MNCFSKLSPSVTCKNLIHPWTDDCLPASIHMAKKCLFGSIRFFGLVQAFQLLSRIIISKRSVDYLFVKKWIRSYLRSIIFGCAIGTSFVSFHCFFRKTCGRYTTYNLGFWPAFLAGSAIFLETKRRRRLTINYYAGITLQIFQRKLKKSKILTWTKNEETLAFMLINGLLMHLLALGTSKHFWFFRPRNIRIDASGLGKTFVEYFLSGLALQLSKGVFSDLDAFVKTPKEFLFRMIRLKNLSFASFLSSYAVGYRAVIKILQMLRRSPSKYDPLIAGFFAGYSYKFSPSTTVLNAAFVTLFEILIKMAVKKNFLPKFPYGEFSFLLWNGIIYHARTIEENLCPKMMEQIMSSLTSRRSQEIYKNLLYFFNNSSEAE